jgi:hypothetical protein
MMFHRIALLVSVIALLGACATIKNQTISSMLEKSSKSFNQMMRWNDAENAGKAFFPEKFQEDFRHKVKGVKITDYRVKHLECLPEKGKATVRVEYDYYREPSVTLHMVEYVQQWEYVTENNSKIWQLQNLPPDMK